MAARVTGLGGVFFRARDPEGLTEWYDRVLGVAFKGGPWMQEAGPTVFMPFDEGTEYFGRRSQAFMLNFRVRDLDEMLAHLASLDIAAETRAEWDSEVGRFARIHDPEGNPIELWEPAPPG
ncbi:VOC family protein [Histidinibacterium lentulum]|uniref:VOC family protein n=1 Tax=Histidinibacterium lentulum TaxID=2480588 RepID=A0A3N2QTR6_9RHOB|nr:VOC family protein [Histidinibacterium lentulum]ROT98604.1 VOC family protein [Histidinibacterium lentulum]